uniref:Uncharacterized protein n=1 Tax=Arundo donax TaxID=35708 RepID=A0A0A9FVT1_ARUDO
MHFLTIYTSVKICNETTTYIYTQHSTLCVPDGDVTLSLS